MRALILLLLLVGCGGHYHGPARSDDPRRLYVLIDADGAHGGALHDGATAGLARMNFAVATRGDADVELQLEATRLDSAGKVTACTVKILVMTLPRHNLVGIADGSGRAVGGDGRARNDCLAGVATSLVRSQVRRLLQRQLNAKR